MSSVKTAISLPESVFEQVEALAKELRVSRSRIFLLAVEAFAERRRSQALFEAISRAYVDPPTREEKHFLRAAKRYHRRKVRREEW
jgi:metal-responsive CopG/Arc/MetJ family transcriptional regulator